MKLISADVCRDGGSIAADFRLNDGPLLSLLLEVSFKGWPHYAHLHAGTCIQNSCDASTIIEKGSLKEKEILSSLRKWKISSLLSEEIHVHPNEKTNHLHWANEMCNRIESRSG
jgi:hypothetical protein